MCQQGLKMKAMVAALLVLGCVCKRDAVRRRVRRLARERMTEEQGFSMRREAIEKGREAVLRRAELEDELDKIDDGIMCALRKSDKARLALHAAASRQVLAALRRYDRQIDQAGKAIAEAEARAAAAAKAERSKAWREKMDRVMQDLSRGEAVPSGGKGTSQQAPAVEQQTAPPASKPQESGSAVPPPPPPPAAPTPDAPESNLYDLTLPPAIFAFPEDGAVLRKKPASYSGKSQPNSHVMVTVGENKFGPVPVNEHGIWRVIGAKVLGLKSGQHRATVAPLSREGKRGRTTSIVFTLQLLFLMLFPLRSLANEILLPVNALIHPPRGLARPPFAPLRDPQADRSTTPNAWSANPPSRPPSIRSNWQWRSNAVSSARAYIVTRLPHPTPPVCSSANGRHLSIRAAEPR